MLFRARLVVCIVALGATLNAGQSVPRDAGTAAISGVVLDAVTKQPVPAAVVYLGPPNHGPQGESQNQLTDSKGRFVFTRLPAFAGYYVTVTKAGYMAGHFGRSEVATGTKIALTSGQWFQDAKVLLRRLGGITGRVTDHRNEPMAGVFVRVLATGPVGAHNQLMAGPVSTTDDHGVYRIADLPAGTYRVQVPSVQSPGPSGVIRQGQYPSPPSPDGESRYVFPPTFFPDVQSVASATVINLSEGEERLDVDVRLTPRPAFRVSGTMFGPRDVFPNLTVRLVPRGLEGLGDGSELASTVADGQGAFRFDNIPTGEYTIEARRSITQLEFKPDGATTSLPRPGGIRTAFFLSTPVTTRTGGVIMTTWSAEGTGQYWGRRSLTVDNQSVSDQDLVLQSAPVLTGRFQWDIDAGRSSGPFPDHVRLEPVNADPSLGLLRSLRSGQSPGTFTVQGLQPGSYILMAAGSFKIKSVQWQGQDYTHRPFDASGGRDILDVVVILTTASTELAGALETIPNDVDDLSVIVFPVRRELWTQVGLSSPQIKITPVTSNHEYRFQDLPAGEYYVIAAESSELDHWREPEFLAAAARPALRATLTWGTRTSLNVPVVHVQR